MLLRLSIAVYVLGIIGLFFYSFTQVDLNLTLQQSSSYYSVQQFFQEIGYFSRPLSAQLYVLLVIIMTASHIGVCILAWKKLVSLKTVIRLTVFTALALFLTYPAFSYDIFNYLFDARIVTKYAENPYIHKALDYPEDPWILFMRWTHRVCPYGPLWLGITVPLSYVGMQQLTLTFLLFKGLAAIGYGASVYLLYKIASVINKKHVLTATVLFATNPLVIIESLVSAHNDIIMMAITLGSFYLLVRKKFVFSGVALIASAAVKFATVLLLPVYAWVTYLDIKKRKIHWEHVVLISTGLMTVAVIVAAVRTQFQPWYLLFVLPFTALFPQNRYFTVPIFIITTAAMLQYAPFLYTGNWDPPIPDILNIIMGIGVVLSFIYMIFTYLAKRASF